MVTEAKTLRRIRLWLALFVAGLVVSGLTAFPLEAETRWLLEVLRSSAAPEHLPTLVAWIERVDEGLRETNDKYPFIAYGTDWLAFAHLVLAVAFWGPYRDPVRNEWVVRFGMIACVSVIPLALICGPIRGIPLYWQFIDMSFGVFGLIPLTFAYRHIRRLQRVQADGPGGRSPAHPDRVATVQ